jgi:hypothetical protein
LAGPDPVVRHVAILSPITILVWIMRHVAILGLVPVPVPVLSTGGHAGKHQPAANAQQAAQSGDHMAPGDGAASARKRDHHGNSLAVWQTYRQPGWSRRVAAADH